MENQGASFLPKLPEYLGEKCGGYLRKVLPGDSYISSWRHVEISPQVCLLWGQHLNVSLCRYKCFPNAIYYSHQLSIQDFLYQAIT